MKGKRTGLKGEEWRVSEMQSFTSVSIAGNVVSVSSCVITTFTWQAAIWKKWCGFEIIPTKKNVSN